TPVSGIYFYEDSTPSPGNYFKFQGDCWTWDEVRGAGTVPPLIRRTSAGEVVVIEYSRQGRPRVLNELPAFLQPDRLATTEYHPMTRVEPGPPSPLAVHRYAF